MWPLLFREIDVLDAADDADDRQPLAIARRLNAFAEASPRGPVTTREWLIDDCYERRVESSFRLKIASLQDGNAERLKRSRRHALHLSLFSFRNVAAFGWFLSFDDDSIDVAAIAEWQISR